MPASPQQVFGTVSSAPDVPDLTPFPRRFPDDLLDCLCAELDDMKSNHPMNVPPTTADKVIQRTLLSIQTINIAGWTAATPYLWRTLRFKKKDDYVSFFIPITRLLQRTPHIQETARVSQASSLMDQGCDYSNGDHHRNDLRRFYRSAQWIRNLVFDPAPPLSLREEIDLAHTIAIEVLGTACYFGRGISLHLNGLTSSLSSVLSWDQECGLLARLIGDTRPANVEVWDTPIVENNDSYILWVNLHRILGLPSNSDQPHLTVHNMMPDRFDYLFYQDLTFRLSSEWIRLANPIEALASVLGEAVSSRICHDHATTDTSPNAGVIRKRSRIAVWGWLGCPCGCDIVSCPESDVRVIIKSISRWALQALRESSLRAMPRHWMEEAIRTFFEEKRLEICGEPCAGYKERERKKER
jgi:hypothetical protein